MRRNELKEGRANDNKDEEGDDDGANADTVLISHLDAVLIETVISLGDLTGKWLARHFFLILLLKSLSILFFLYGLILQIKYKCVFNVFCLMFLLFNYFSN